MSPQDRDEARRGEGPTLIDAKCWRIYGHYQDDPAKYKTKEYLQLQESKDPVKRLAAFMTENGIASAARLAEMSATIDQKIDAALAESMKAPMPRPEEALEDTYASY